MLFNKRALLITLGVVSAFAWAIPARSQSSVVDTKHNLSLSVIGPAQNTHYPGACSMCHAAHGSFGPQQMWARPDSLAVYQPYQSESIKAYVGQPTGASKRCLSCHDGTLALAPSHGENFGAGVRLTEASSSYIGTDLRDDHPVSFSYIESISSGRRDLAPASALTGPVKLDRAGFVQCTSCHDPHDNTYGHFLTQPNRNGELCVNCHQFSGFMAATHATVTLSGANGLLRAAGVRQPVGEDTRSGCNACHLSHTSPSREQLLLLDEEKTLCLACHDGRQAQSNIAAALNKPYAHPVGMMPRLTQTDTDPFIDDGSVECSDCHNPHRSNAASSTGLGLPGAMVGVSGVDESGNLRENAMFEYQVCFKCHSRESNQSLDHIIRQVDNVPVSRQFAQPSASAHPVITPASRANSPSLRRGLNGLTRITCSDCHGGDGSGGGAAGPHGSRFPFILKQEYRAGDEVSESASAYALCYQCHDRISILNDESFRYHQRHVVQGRVSCSVCHDAHGVPADRDDPARHQFLMNFDLSIVQPEIKSGRIDYISLGPRSGYCNLNCHGENHERRGYGL